MTEQTYYMSRAIALAKKGLGFTNPNPLVGAVVVKNGHIIGQGYHARFGGLHAERAALQNCTADPAGATLYVTLEPCCHHGHQPPCTDAILESGIQTVYIGSRDPNPLVAGKGVEILRRAGITVHTDFLRAECNKLNPIFFHYITTRRPYVILKYAMTADGKIACKTGASRFVTGEAARAHVHQTRKQVMAVFIGIGTALSDDPLLTCRAENPSQPARVVLDTHLRLPTTSRLVRTAQKYPLILFTNSPDPEKKRHLASYGAHIEEVEAKNGNLDLDAVLLRLGAMGIDSVLVEGGAKVHASFLQSGFWNKLQVYVAPKLFGGDGLSPTGAMQIETPAAAVLLSRPAITRLGEDILLEYEKRV